MEIKGEEEMGEKLRNDGRVEGRIRNQENKKEKKKIDQSRRSGDLC